MKKINKNQEINVWINSMENVPCFIIGNGPSLKDVDLDVLKPYFTIGINRAFYKIDPTILIWQDQSLWMQEKKRIKKIEALIYCRENSAPGIKKAYNFKLDMMSKKDSSKLTSTPTTLYGRGSSLAITFQLAHVLGCNPIVLLGVDCRNKGKLTDFYGVNPMHRAQTLPVCKRALKWIREVNHGRTVISCSRNKVFDNITLEKALENIKNLEEKTRKEWIKKLFKK